VADEAPGAGLLMLAARPNPFAFSTDVPFTLDRRGYALLRIHDASGRVLRTLLDGELPAGERRVTWDGRTDGGQRVPAGIYLLNLQVDGVTVSQKVALLGTR
jgi:flagellar hook assembly protein FlgD